MPNIAAHYVCGKLVAKKLNINDDNYIKGNITPDYVDIKRHYRIKGRKFQIPDIEKFIREDNDENKIFKIGFMTHLLLDKLFLEDFVINNIYSNVGKSVNIFESDKIYKDYTNMSKRLLDHYNLTIDEIDELMLKDKKLIDIDKFRDNVDVIKESDSEELKYIDLNSFIEFLNASADKICEFLKIIL